MSPDQKTHLKNVEKLADGIRDAIITDCLFLLKSGGVDSDRYNTDEYTLAIILVSAAIERNKHNFYPTSHDHVQTTKNLIRM